MSMITMFFYIIPILSFLLILINLVFAPSNPYKEKKTPFECGYHSFFTQNRIQFTIIFFSFGFLFMLLDLEIILIFPFTVTSHFNDAYGTVSNFIFIFILVVGFFYELGNNALTIDTKQDTNKKKIPYSPHPFVEMNIKSSMFDFFKYFRYEILKKWFVCFGFNILVTIFFSFFVKYSCLKLG